MKILVTGGCGYIGSHTCVQLLENGFDVIILDNLCNSTEYVLERIKHITNKEVLFYKGNVQDERLLEKIFTENTIDAVIHFAGLKSVGESVKKPLLYYDNNLNSTLALCKIMSKYNCKKLIFSSSATVYGANPNSPLVETELLSTTNPYGTTKLYIEGILKDLYNSDNEWSICILRYFNPIGAHQSGLLGENPKDIPNNLMPYIVKVATGELEFLNVFGDDYDTVDGTGVRDYIHVVDLANGHLKALNKLDDKKVNIYNLGTGEVFSVLQIINIFEKVNKVKIKYKIVDKRSGDVPIYYADATKALKELNWKANFGIEQMCRDSYNFAIKCKEETPIS